MRSSRRASAVAVAVAAALVAIPAAAQPESAAAPKPIGRLVKVIRDDVYVAGRFVTDSQSLYAGRQLETRGSGRARFELHLKDTTCTMRSNTRILVRPRPRVALRVTSTSGRVWCGMAKAVGTASIEVRGRGGRKTTIRAVDPVFGLVVSKERAVVKVRQGAVVVSGRSKAVVVGRAAQVVVPHGGDPRAPEPIVWTPEDRAESASVLVPRSSDKSAPRVRLRSVPPRITTRVASRFDFGTTDDEGAGTTTYACDVDGTGFYVCSPPVVKAFRPGRHTFEVRAVDAAGNFGTPVKHVWTVARPPAGWIVFQSTRDDDYELYAMNADGSGQVRLTTRSGFEGDPSWSPSGHHVVFESDRDSGRSAEIYVMTVDGRFRRRLTRNSTNDRNPRWSPAGDRIAFEGDRGGSAEIFAVGVDGVSQPTPLTENDARDGEPAWSPDGTKIVFESDRDGNTELYVMDADGSDETRLTYTSSAEFNPSWSPDGTKIAFNSGASANHDIHVIDADGSSPTRLTTTVARDADPTWSPDGRRIAFSSNRDNANLDIYVMNADGSRQTRLTTSPKRDYVPDW